MSGNHVQPFISGHMWFKRSTRLKMKTWGITRYNRIDLNFTFKFNGKSKALINKKAPEGAFSLSDSFSICYLRIYLVVSLDLLSIL